MKKITSFILFCLLTLLFSVSAFALPTITATEDQTFETYQNPTQLFDLLITEDSTTNYIKTGELKLTIPEGLPMIFDDELSRENLRFFGTAVDTDKVGTVINAKFTDKDKSLTIPITGNFDPNESFTISGLYVEGFYSSPPNSMYLTLTLHDGSKVSSTRYLYINSTSNPQTQPPEYPSSITVSDDATGVKITWADPTDLDLQLVQILRGKNGASISGTPYAEIADGVQQYIDTDVKAGDTVKYILRATDGKNFSPNTEEITFVVGSTIVEEEPTPPIEEEPTPAPIPDGQMVCTELYAPICGMDNKTYSNACKAGLENIEVAYQGECQVSKPVPSDIENHWSKDYALALFNRGIIQGHPDGTFKPDSNLNRAEAAVLLYRAIYNSDSAPQKSSTKPFSDVSTDAWYSGYIGALKDIGIIKGNLDGTYEPNETINRAEFLTLALNAYYHWTTDERKQQVDNFKAAAKTKKYADLENAWYTATVTAATELGFVEGQACGDKTCFNPSSSITRAESAKILFEMFFK